MSVGEEKKVVLAVDDVSMNLMIIKKALSPFFDVRLAKSGELALFIVGATKVDLVLMDIEMPGMSGYECINAMKENPDTANIPVIFITAHTWLTESAKARQGGVVDFISKPVDIDELVQKAFRILQIEAPV